MDKIRKFKIIIPPLSLQTQFAQIVEKVVAIKGQYQQSLQELEQLYGSLNQKAFKGELPMKEKRLLQVAEPNIEYKKSEKY
jgi:type I restriction enzyme S subunit